MTGGWRFSAKSKQGELTAPGQKLSKSQINILTRPMWLSGWMAVCCRKPASTTTAWAAPFAPRPKFRRGVSNVPDIIEQQPSGDSGLFPERYRRARNRMGSHPHNFSPNRILEVQQ
jgi:hypothetical protein